MKKMYIIGAVVFCVVACIAVVTILYYIFMPNHRGDPTKFNRVFRPEEQQLIQNTLFSLSDLSQYDGQSGRKAYIAVQGVVYDVTSQWKEGQHHNLQAGSDLTNAFLNARHGLETLDKLTVVGGLKP